ncbi:hypothetical protein B0O80DRAFT_528125 [Mortierella sp. GBAus27b]|nr:hypothetical protein BGX31_007111 [Mortierella sp. GBA43]KAI8356531.1 hypothetical protein B0O80DRAFT_528125 [Mortierella sp. GBAus27b]
MSHSYSSGETHPTHSNAMEIQSRDTLVPSGQDQEATRPRHGFDKQKSSADTTSTLHNQEAIYGLNIDIHDHINNRGSPDAPQPLNPLQEPPGNTSAVVDTKGAVIRGNVQESRHEPAEPTLDDDGQGSLRPILTSWDAASERVGAVTLQCLSKDKDMEMSYVSILSAMTVLQSNLDQPPELDDQVQSVDRRLLDSKKAIAKTYSQILILMCRSDIAEGLGKETLRQGVMSSEALYTQFYGSIQQAGYDLEDGAHLAMARYWVECRKIEEAQECLAHISPDAWTGPIYRETIRCLLLSKPRQLHEAELLLQKYMEFLKTHGQPMVEEESKVRTWYKLQVDDSKWEEAKDRYEHRRARLVDGPSNSESIATDSESKLTPQALQQHLLQEQQKSPSKHLGHVRTKSVTSSTTTSSYRRSPPSQYGQDSSGHRKSSSSHQRAPSVAPSWPSGAPTPISSNTSVAPSWPSGAPTPMSTSASVAPSWPSGAPTSTSSGAPAATPKGALSFFSSLKFTKSSDTETVPSPSTALPSRFNVNRHLTALDNGMLEECINFNEFEYGWKQIYEKMGSTLEDADTAKIAMRLCRRAFLGHSGLDPTQPGSPNLVARDVIFNDDLTQDATSTRLNQGAETWEARAWVIYNKAIMNPLTLLSNKAGSTSHSHTMSTSSNHMSSAVAGSTSQASSSLTPSAVFFHDILTIAVHSPEVSSRYLKAFKIYSAMRSDQHFQNQLRDPFVMSCMIKAIYDAALAVVHNPEQNTFPPSEKKPGASRHHRRSSSISLNRAQPMTLGPLMDLAFEIYADMRNVGPIRHLPSLVSLAPTSPVSKNCKSPSPRASFTSSADDPVDLGTTSTISISPRSSFTVLAMPTFQDLNPTLHPNPQARRLPTELYLALLHLCIHVPTFKISSQVVRTIIHDTGSDSRRQRLYLDLHISAALQSYHDTWMCSIDAESTEDLASLDLQRRCCDYRGWMYKSDEEVQKYITASKRVSSASVFSEASNSGHSTTDVGSAANGLTKELESLSTLEDDQQDQGLTCNDQFYWDLWSNDDAALKNVQYSKTKARMLWDHVAQVLL